MHAVTVLREDHERIRALLERLSGNGRDPRLLELVNRELAVHMLAEDNIFLPQVEDAIEDARRTTPDAGAFAGAREILAAAYENHRAVEALIARPPDRTEQLARLVGRQVELEESLYAEAEKVLEKEDFERIGDLIEHCKWQVRGLTQAGLASSSSFEP